MASQGTGSCWREGGGAGLGLSIKEVGPQGRWGGALSQFGDDKF